MYIDKEMLLCDAQAFSADAESTNAIDLGNVTPKNDPGAGERMVVKCTVDVAADYTTADETYEFQFIQSANANLSSPDNLISRTIAAATLVAGYEFEIPIPAGAINKRYVGLYFNGGGTTPTITLTAFLTLASMVDARKNYAKGYTIT